MREIKFRAWDDLEQRFWTLKDGGETSGDGSVQYFGNEQGVLEMGRLEEIDTGLGTAFEFTAFSLMQFTGLTDKNGREIYEGDILTGGILHMTSGVRLSNESVATTVTFRDGMFKLGKVSLLSFHKNAEVIGNIYENPELLEVTK